MRFLLALSRSHRVALLLVLTLSVAVASDAPAIQYQLSSPSQLASDPDNPGLQQLATGFIQIPAESSSQSSNRLVSDFQIESGTHSWAKHDGQIEWQGYTVQPFDIHPSDQLNIFEPNAVFFYLTLLTELIDSSDGIFSFRQIHMQTDGFASGAIGINNLPSSFSFPNVEVEETIRYFEFREIAPCPLGQVCQVGQTGLYGLPDLNENRILATGVLTFSAVPEPSSGLLVGLGLCLFPLARRGSRVRSRQMVPSAAVE